MKFKQVRGSWATFIYDEKPDDCFCNLKQLAETLLNWANTPKTICDVKAMELSLLAKRFIEIQEEIKAMEEKSESWMRDYDKLKAKYEPSFAVIQEEK